MLSSFLTNFNASIVFYLKLRSMYFSQKQAVWVMSIMSIVNSISRVASGWLADRKWINRRVLFCVAYFVAACAITSLYLWRSYWLLMFTCIVFSVSAGWWQSFLTSSEMSKI